MVGLARRRLMGLQGRGGAGGGHATHARPVDPQDEDTIVLQSIKPAAAAFGVAEDAKSMARRPRRRWHVVVHFLAADSPDIVVPATAVLTGAQGGGHSPRAAVLLGPHQAVQPR
jgi:hypothetical protein